MLDASFFFFFSFFQISPNFFNMFYQSIKPSLVCFLCHRRETWPPHCLLPHRRPPSASRMSTLGIRRDKRSSTGFPLKYPLGKKWPLLAGADLGKSITSALHHQRTGSPVLWCFSSRYWLNILFFFFLAIGRAQSSGCCFASMNPSKVASILQARTFEMSAWRA